MLISLLQFLGDLLSFKVPSVFTYYSTRMILASLMSLFLTISLGPYCILKLYNLKTGQSIRVSDCPLLAKLHEKKKHTPTMGGVLMLFSIIISLLCFMDITSIFTIILLFATLVLGAVGMIDDYLKMKHKNAKGLPGRIKLLMQLSLSLLIALYLLVPGFANALETKSSLSPPSAKEYKMEKSKNPEQLSLSEYQSIYYLPFMKSPFFVVSGAGMLIALFITMFVITGASNAVNLSDGLDGLAPGLIMMVSAVLALFGFLSNHVYFAKYLNILYIESSGEIAIFLSAIFGANLGFLWFNSHPAQVFMGDTGSLSLGGLLGICAVLLRREFLFALVGGVFVIEALSVILQVLSYKLRNKKRIFLCAPIHHHFEYKGWHETKVVARFWIVGLVLAVIGIASLKFQ
ncbi:phospho-N-acetylmuramoyl-pentapeptide-transferase [Candidatus Aerophobetes bacterium]|uniref:Phospho-N-acetylmuramoyl-pentapeptide-transferase n=1 Tax=Aerophobetes bacterium TaxID=2030807 RepID=A0A2A4YII5_UNCAE|nr:MAG: phospho-N-acetylmuramoyl-pentapeptide-transferase [Candidatus Aerophobetes bacterium]